MRSLVRAAVALAAVGMLAPTIVAAQAKPVVAVLYFDNNSIGKDRTDFDGVGKGIADMLITDMASNPNVRVVERERVQALVTEQNLVKSGAIDATTAIRLGKMIGAQYMITGGFISDGKGTYVVTARAINVETSAITNPVRLTDKGQDVLGLIAQLSSKINTEMKLPALRTGDAGNAPAGNSPASASAAAPANAPAATPAPTKAPAARPAATSNQSAKKMDIRTAMLYSKALDAEDAGNKTQAVELYRQVVKNFPDYAPAKQKIAKLSSS